MNNKHRKTLAAIFSNPTLKSLVWADIESLFLAIGCEVLEGAVSRVAFIRDDQKADFHRPHPGKEAKPYQVQDAKKFLINLGVTP